MEINEIYKLLQNNKWEDLLNFEKENRDIIIENENLKHVFEIYFIPQVLKYIKSVDSLYSTIVLKKIYFHFLHIRNTTYNIDKKIFETLVQTYIDSLIKNQKKKHAYSIAEKWIHIPSINNFIEEYEKENLKEVSHNQDDLINLKVNAPETKKQAIPLFKSNQESEFFYALRDIYQNHLIYPNVALSCIIDIEKLKDELSEEELKYFYSAIIDCVIFKHEDNNFFPELCFELDSIYHDDENQIKKDLLKNQILTKSGFKIYRIRSNENKSLKREELKKLIKETLNLR